MYFRLFLVTVLFAGFASTAQAANVAFPPDNCTPLNPFMSFKGTDTNENTYCSNGQSVLKNALPQCAADQVVVFDGSLFICKTETVSYPTCEPNEFLTYNGASLECRDPSVPSVCAEGQVITYTIMGWQCVSRENVPTCGPN